MKNPVRSWLLAAFVLTLISNAAGQQAAPQQPPADTAQAKKFYEDLITSPIVPLRPEEVVKADLEAAKQDGQKADQAIAAAQARVKEAEGWLVTHKTEMQGLKAKANTAKKEKREADKLTIEAQLKQLELVDDYLKKVKETRESELDIAKANKELVSAKVKVFEAEANLHRKAGAIKSAAGSPALNQVVAEAKEAGEATLKAMKEAADKGQDVSSRMKSLADRRLDLATVRNKLLTEDRIKAAAAGMGK